ncbi:MAG: nuclear transport factor 2 family protein [Thermoproteota archaeon]|nr:nuclear transport factor 2 family protein [Thermoproteota archaeon]
MSALALPDPINRFVEAVNRGDNESFLDFFPRDGLVEDSGRRFVGHDAIRRWSDAEFIGAKGHMTVTSVEQKENVVNVTADWASNYFSGPSRFVFVLKDKKIAEMRITSE